MTTESIFTHDEDGRPHLRRTGNLEQRVTELERQVAALTQALTQPATGSLSTRTITERLERLEHRQDAQRERLALAGIREDRG